MVAVVGSYGVAEEVAVSTARDLMKLVSLANGVGLERSLDFKGNFTEKC